MELLRRNLLIVILLLINQSYIQSQNIVLDIETYKPITYVNIYSKNGLNVNATTSNEKGEFNIKFPYRTVVFNHINYEILEINKKEMKDTIYLQPFQIELDEVKVISQPQDWILPLLKDVVKKRKLFYPLEKTNYDYNYFSNSISDSSGYAFKSKGSLEITNYFDKEIYIKPLENIIYYKDSVAGPDFSGLQTMIYNSFIENFNNRFIRNYNFKNVPDYQTENSQFVKLLFQSKEFNDDKGFIVIDKNSKAIVEFKRESGTQFNIKNNTSSVFRIASSKLMGRGLQDLQIDLHVKFLDYKNNYHLSEIKLKFFISTVDTKTDKSFFSSSESKIILKPIELRNEVQYIWLPSPMYIGIISKKRNIAYENLQNIKLEFKEFDLTKKE